MGERWIRFLRQYGPIPRNDNMYDEHIMRSALRLGVTPLHFEHPLEQELLAAVAEEAPRATSIVLTGTAGDGKSRLCGLLWSELGGASAQWAGDDIYHETSAVIAGRERTVGVVRDLTALPEQGSFGSHGTKSELLKAISRSILEIDPDHVFVVAANDGQLLEAWRRMTGDPESAAVRDIFETRLVTGRPGRESLTFLNLSTIPCTTIFRLASAALIAHEGWQAAYADAQQDGFFGESCPIRRNYERLSDNRFQDRVGELFELMDLSELHTPIRRVLLLLANALLGHPDARDRLMSAGDVRGLVAKRTAHRGSIERNLLGRNLTEARREGLEIIEALNRFGIGAETTNRIDNILLYGLYDGLLTPDWEATVAAHATPSELDELQAQRSAYLERPDAEGDGTHPFIQTLADQRRAMFFRIPRERAAELRLWNLTVFSHAGEFLDDVVRPLRARKKVSRAIIARLVRGLNRVFTGLLVDTDRELLLATSLSGSGRGPAELLEDRIAVSRRDERIELDRGDRLPVLRVQLDADTVLPLRLNLVRYEFLMRVADGALPGSFSRECHEDILGFKSVVLAAAARLRPPEPDGHLTFRLLRVTTDGEPSDETVEVLHA
ncbi:hypothetical protein ASF20_19235 [Methylobacterium sp. Leaf88]|nr:hypothetical protein ASF20_19235 [Methylobacterium sp. Leaf88]